MRDKSTPLWVWLRQARKLHPNKSPIFTLTGEIGDRITLGYAFQYVQNCDFVYWTMARWVKRKKAVSVERFERLEALAMQRYRARRKCFQSASMGCVWVENDTLKTVDIYDAPGVIHSIDKLRDKRVVYREKTISDDIDAQIMCLEIDKILQSGAIEREHRRLSFLRDRYETTAIHA